MNLVCPDLYAPALRLSRFLAGLSFFSCVLVVYPPNGLNGFFRFPSFQDCQCDVLIVSENNSAVVKEC